MKTAILYPVPNENSEVWATFKPFVERFTYTLRRFSTGMFEDWEVIPMLFCEYEACSIWPMFRQIPVNRVFMYRSYGMDIGAAQQAALAYEDFDFAVCCTTRVYFHQANWLKKLIHARTISRPGLYGTSVSREGGRLHICTRLYGVDRSLFIKYPHIIDSRDKGTFFEVGNGCPDGSFTDWVETQNAKRMVVYRDGAHSIERAFDSRNIFRRGDQSNLLCWDKHSDIFRDASPDEKIRLSEMCFNGK